MTARLAKKVRLTPKLEAEVLRQVLGKQKLEKLSASQLSNKAHWRSNRGQHLEAAVLWDAAAAKSAKE